MPKTQAHDGTPDKTLWLEAALQLLAEGGPNALSVKALCAKVNADKRQFGTRFDDKAQLIREAAEYWRHRDTETVLQLTYEPDWSPLDKLRIVVEAFTDLNLDALETPIRALAQADEAVAKTVRKVDRTRLEFLRENFAALGFDEAALEVRARTFLCALIAEPSLSERKSKTHRRALARQRLAFFIAGHPKKMTAGRVSERSR